MSNQPVAIRVRGREYMIRTDGDVDDLERIAACLDDTMARVEERTGTVDSLGVAMLTALNLAREVVELREAGGTPADAARLRELIELAESSVEAVPASA